MNETARTAVFSLALIVLTMLVAKAQAEIHGGVLDGKIVLLSDAPVETNGIDLQSAAGVLVPVPDPPGAGPFTFFLSNTPNQITWGNLGSTTTIDGDWKTEAGYTGDPETGDLVGFWGDGASPRPIDFEILESANDQSGRKESLLMTLNEKRLEWEELGIENYSFNYELGGCECPFIGATVHVRNGEVSFLTNNVSDDFSGNKGDDFVTAEDFINFDEMFEIAERQIDTADSVSLEFDRDLPIPKRFFFDRFANTADDESLILVSNFAIVPEPELSLLTWFYLTLSLLLVRRSRFGK